MNRIDTPEYVSARAAVRAALSVRLVDVDRVYDVVESILTSGELRGTKRRGLSPSIVVITLLQLTKALKTFRAIRAAALEGCGQDAGTLLRSLFETCTAVLWILQRDTRRRATLFAAHADVRRLIMAEEQAKTPGLKRLGRKRVAEVCPLIDGWTKMLGASTMKAIRKHWSGLGGGIEQVSRRIKTWSIAYNTVYRETSSTAHGADPAEHAILVDGHEPVYKLLPGTDECDRVLAVAAVLLHTLAGRMDARMGLGFASALSSVKLSRIKMPTLPQRRAAKQ